MTPPNNRSPASIVRDLTAGMVVFLVALPLCLGVALASTTAPDRKPELIAGLLSGIVGGILVGLLSGSHTSVSGPAAGLTTVVAAQIALLGSFEAFLLAVFIAGLIQIAMGLARAGFIAAFFPSSVIKGLLAAIGVILILKQIPHVLGHDANKDLADLAFFQLDDRNTFSEFMAILEDLHAGAAIIGILSIILLVLWDRSKWLKKSNVPAPLLVVLLGVALDRLFERYGGSLDIEASHLVQVPVPDHLTGFFTSLKRPDFSQWLNPAVYGAGFTIAMVASLETLLNLQAVDKLDPQQRSSPPNRELLAQGIGNVIVGLIGGIPMTSVIVRSSVNINAGGQTKLSAIVHGVLLFVSVIFLPEYLNQIPLSCLAAILLVTGVKLASPSLMKQMWNGGRLQFVPFAVTLLAIVLTDLLIGVLIGLVASISFILYSNFRRPVRRVAENHLGGEVLRVELANQVSFFHRAALEKILRGVPRGGHVLLDARNTYYIDPDILDLIRDFRDQIAPAHGVQVSFRGFRERYQLQDDIQYIDYSTREVQEQLTAAQVLQILHDGNKRFLAGRRLTRDPIRQLDATARGQHPLAVVLSCIDSRTPAELIFDLGLGDIFSVRIAGNITTHEIIGSMEYGCAVAGAKLILVLGHTQCGAVGAAVNLAATALSADQATGCQHLEPIVREIHQSIDVPTSRRFGRFSTPEKAAFVDNVARRNVLRAIQQITEQSRTISDLVNEGRIAVAGALYDVASGKIEFLTDVKIEERDLAASRSMY